MLNLTVKLAGYYKLIATKPDGSKRLVADWFPNLITNGGMDHFAGSMLWFPYCQVGTGSAAPSFTDSALVTYLATNSSYSTSKSLPVTPNYYTEISAVYRFNAGVATGNLSEVGIGWTSASGNLFSRALILDGEGAPTTITILADETLDVHYEFRYYIPIADVTGSVTLRGDVYNWVSRPCEIDVAGYIDLDIMGHANTDSYRAYDGAIGPVTGNPSGSSDISPDLSLQSYTPSSYYRDAILTLGLTNANFGAGIGAYEVQWGLCRYQIGFTPKIPKTADDVLTLNLRIVWART